MIDQIFVWYRLKIRRRLPLSSVKKPAVLSISDARKSRCLFSFHSFHHLYDGFVPFPQKYIVAVFHCFFVIHRGVETAHHNDGIAFFLKIARQLVSTHSIKGKNTDKYNVRVHKVLHHQPRDCFAVHQRVRYFFFHNRCQRVQSDRGRSDISVVHKIIQRRRFVGSVSRLYKTYFHTQPAFYTSVLTTCDAYSHIQQSLSQFSLRTILLILQENIFADK